MAEQTVDKTYAFEDFQMDPSRRLLTRGSGREPVNLTPKAFQVLLHLVENHGRLVTKNDLMATVWEDSFVEEGNLTQTISVLRKALGDNRTDHRFIVTESGRGYRFVAPVEVLNAYLTQPGHPGSDARVSRVNWKPYVAVGVAILLTALVGFAIYRSASNPGAAVAATEIKAIAVLPFMSVEPGDDNKLIGIGMADAVIAKLSHVKSVAVRQTSSVIRYADSTPEAVRIGRDINVDAVLEGTIQKADFRIRVSVRLFRVSDGSLIWAETFDERETDIFSVQDAISERVANSLSLQLTGDERVRFNRRSTGNLEAYLLYNKGRFFWNRRNSEDLRKSIDLYEQAIAKDPNYALAYAGIAESYVLLHTYSRHHESDLFPRARAAAEKALSLDENLAEAHAALALYREQYEWNWAEAEQGFKRAIAANPSYATAHQWYGEFLAFRGRTDESIVEVRKALDLDPLSLSTNAAQAFPLIAGRRWAEAIEKVQPALELDKNFPFALYYLARSYEGLGEYDRAIENYQKAIEVSGASAFFSSAMIHSLVKAGKRAEAERHLSLILENDRNEPVSRYVLARGLAALGERARALDALEQAHENRDGLLTVIQIDPNFDEIRDDPRFKNIVKKIGF